MLRVVVWTVPSHDVTTSTTGFVRMAVNNDRMGRTGAFGVASTLRDSAWMLPGAWRLAVLRPEGAWGTSPFTQKTRQKCQAIWRNRQTSPLMPQHVPPMRVPSAAGLAGRSEFASRVLCHGKRILAGVVDRLLSAHCLDPGAAL